MAEIRLLEELVQTTDLDTEEIDVVQSRVEELIVQQLCWLQGLRRHRQSLTPWQIVFMCWKLMQRRARADWL